VHLKYVDPAVRYPPGWNHTDEPGMVEDDVSYLETWAAMEELVNEGLVRSIGVSNVGTTLIREVWNVAKIKPAVL
jgi:D-xylose reductase